MENTTNNVTAKDETDEPNSPTDKDDEKPSLDLENKIELLFKATGNAPILKKKKWLVEASRKMGYVNSFIRRLLKLNPNDSLFIYVNQSFAPSMDQTVENVYSCFGADNRLEIQYCKSQAWG